MTRIYRTTDEDRKELGKNLTETVDATERLITLQYNELKEKDISDLCHLMDTEVSEIFRSRRNTELIREHTIRLVALANTLLLIYPQTP